MKSEKRLKIIKEELLSLSESLKEWEDYLKSQDYKSDNESVDTYETEFICDVIDFYRLVFRTFKIKSSEDLIDNIREMIKKSDEERIPYDVLS